MGRVLHKCDSLCGPFLYRRVYKYLVDHLVATGGTLRWWRSAVDYMMDEPQHTVISSDIIYITYNHVVDSMLYGQQQAAAVSAVHLDSDHKKSTKYVWHETRCCYVHHCIILLKCHIYIDTLFFL